MKTLRQVEIIPVFLSDDEFMPKYETFDEREVYISERYKCTIHRCLCGCGERTVLPLDPVHGWVMTKNENGTISFTPSVGNYQMPCKSHYIITNNIANFV